LNSTER